MKYAQIKNQKKTWKICNLSNLSRPQKRSIENEKYSQNAKKKCCMSPPWHEKLFCNSCIAAEIFFRAQKKRVRAKNLNVTKNAWDLTSSRTKVVTTLLLLYFVPLSYPCLLISFLLLSLSLIRSFAAAVAPRDIITLKLLSIGIKSFWTTLASCASCTVSALLSCQQVIAVKCFKASCMSPRVQRKIDETRKP